MVFMQLNSRAAIGEMVLIQYKRKLLPARVIAFAAGEYNLCKKYVITHYC